MTVLAMVTPRLPIVPSTTPARRPLDPDVPPSSGGRSNSAVEPAGEARAIVDGDGAAAEVSGDRALPARRTGPLAATSPVSVAGDRTAWASTPRPARLALHASTLGDGEVHRGSRGRRRPAPRRRDRRRRDPTRHASPRPELPMRASRVSLAPCSCCDDVVRVCARPAAEASTAGRGCHLGASIWMA